MMPDSAILREGGVWLELDAAIIGRMNNELVYFFGIPVYFLAILAFLVAGFYAIFWPKKLVGMRTFSSLQLFFLRWGHALSWVCLALALVAWGASQIPLAILLAIAGGLVYLVFMVSLIGQGRPK